MMSIAKESCLGLRIFGHHQNHQNYAKEVLEIVKKIQHKNNITKMTLS